MTARRTLIAIQLHFYDLETTLASFLREKWVIIAAHRQNGPWSGETLDSSAVWTPTYAKRLGAFMGHRMIADLANLKVGANDGTLRVKDKIRLGYLANVKRSEFESSYATLRVTNRYVLAGFSSGTAVFGHTKYDGRFRKPRPSRRSHAKATRWV